MRRFPGMAAAAAALSVCLLAIAEPTMAAQFAVNVVEYVPGATPTPGYTDPLTALGLPERFTGEDLGFPSVVSPFSPPFGTDEVVSIGQGGHLTLELGTPATNNPANPFGIDLIVFTNAGFADDDFPHGRVSDPPFLFGLDEMLVEVSADGTDFLSLGSFLDANFPTQGWLDGGPFDPVPGTAPSDFFLPVDPTLTLDDFAGLTLAQLRALYAGSGGGTPIDLAASGLPEARFIRLSPAPGVDNIEIDAVTVVPEPAALVVLLIAAPVAFRRK